MTAASSSPRPDHQRVVVTGLGAITNLGRDVPTIWSALQSGKSGIDTIQCFDQAESVWSCKVAGEVRDWTPAPVVDDKAARRMDRYCQLAMWAAEEAVQDSGFDFTTGDPYRHGVVVGSGIGGISTIEQGIDKLHESGPRRISPFTVPRLMLNSAAGNISIRHGLKGPNSAIGTACATGGHNILSACDLIRLGRADVMVAGGSEASITPLCIGSFGAMKAMSTARNESPTEASRPFDRDRDGFVMGEGAAILVLESLAHAKARGARVHAEILGGGITGDAGHITAPDENGEGGRRAMAFALQEAGCNLEDVDSINAHGTSTPLGDVAEVRAIRNLFGDHAPSISVCSTKSMIGHTLGAAGGLETVFSVLSCRDGVVPPTINCDNPDEEFAGLDFTPHTARERTVRLALNNTFGFGGHNVSVAVGRFED